MESAQALAVVRSLANGVDPESGEIFPPESAYQRPQVVRALYEAATALERIERFERRKAQMPPKTGETGDVIAQRLQLSRERALLLDGLCLPASRAAGVLLQRADPLARNREPVLGQCDYRVEHLPAEPGRV